MDKTLDSSAVKDRPADQKKADRFASTDTEHVAQNHASQPEPGDYIPPSGSNRFNLQSASIAPQEAPPLPEGIFNRLALRAKHKAQHTLSDARALGSMLLLCCIVGTSALGGYLLGKNQPRERAGLMMMQAIISAQVSSLDGEDEDPTIRPADAQAAYIQKEMSSQLGLMRAELLRLHTVFVQLAQIAELDDGEFDLQSPLLDWKDQSSLEQLGLLNRRIAHMSDYSGTISRIFNLRRMAYDQKISGRPLVEGHRTSGFGYRTDPITGERLEHLGLDFSGPVGEPILALADGIVTFSGKNSGYGNLVELEHVDGLRTRYAHNQLLLVGRGASVKKGQAIATLGSTGRSTGPHVHIEVRLDGTPIDPGFFIR